MDTLEYTIGCHLNVDIWFVFFGCVVQFGCFGTKTNISRNEKQTIRKIFNGPRRLIISWLRFNWPFYAQKRTHFNVGATHESNMPNQIKRWNFALAEERSIEGKNKHGKIQKCIEQRISYQVDQIRFTIVMKP